MALIQHLLHCEYLLQHLQVCVREGGREGGRGEGDREEGGRGEGDRRRERGEGGREGRELFYYLLTSLMRTLSLLPVVSFLRKFHCMPLSVVTDIVKG